MEKSHAPEEQEIDISDLLLQTPEGRSYSALYLALLIDPQNDTTIPRGTLKIDLDLTDIEDKKIIERIAGEVKFLLESKQTRDRFTSVHIKVKRSQMNHQAINYKMAFPSKYEVIEDLPQNSF